MSTEAQKMLAGEMYDPLDPELIAARMRARDLCRDLNATRESDEAERRRILRDLFAKGASLKDPGRLFNASLDGNVRRAMDIHKGEKVDETAFKALIRQAAALNRSGKSKPKKTKS